MKSLVSQDKHHQYMRRALQLAAGSLGRTSPNPAVGAVVVRDGHIVGEGYHQAAGQPHAEVNALNQANQLAQGADLYVTLEPCSTAGRTPPCTEAISRAGIKRVIYACQDCDSSNAGRADQVLSEKGIQTIGGLLEDQARRLNEAYFKHKTTGLPFVTVKLACSLDGKIATRTGDSRWVTEAEAREYVHQLRDRSDAVMVGIGTVLADDPALTTRLDSPEARDALRIIVDTHSRTPAAAQVVSSPSEAGCIIATTAEAPQSRIERLRRSGAEVWELPEKNGKVDLAALMQALGQRDIMSVLVEGGSTLVGGLLAEGLVDKLLMFYAPKIVGDRQALSAVNGLQSTEMSETIKFEITDIQQIGADVLITAYLPEVGQSPPCSPD